MRFQKAFFILALFVAVVNFSRAAEPSPAPVTPPSIAVRSNMAEQTAAENGSARGEAKVIGELQNSPVQPQLTSNAPAKPVIAAAPMGSETDAERFHQRRLLMGLIIGLLAGAVVYQFLRRQKSSQHL